MPPIQGVHTDWYIFSIDYPIGFKNSRGFPRVKENHVVNQQKARIY